VQRIEQFDHNLLVDALRTEAGDGCLTLQAFSQPFHIVSLTKARLDADLMTRTERFTCSASGVVPP
jgi:hypothetical protein